MKYRIPAKKFASRAMVAAAAFVSLATNASQIERASTPLEIKIPGEHIYPESLTSAADGTIFIGSIGLGAIYRVPPGESSAALWIEPHADGLANILGVYADDRNKTLWVCSDYIGPPTTEVTAIATLYAFDLTTGASKAHYPLPTPKGLCNDIAVDRDGSVYVTDSNNMEIVRLKRGATALDTWSGGGAYGPPGGILDGISILGPRVFVNTLMTNKLFGVKIAGDGKAKAVSELKLNRPIAGPDGMRSFGKASLLLVEGAGSGRLSRVDLLGNTAKVTSLKEGYPDGAVAVTLVACNN